MSWNENAGIFIKVLLKFAPKGSITNKPVSVGAEIIMG